MAVQTDRLVTTWKLEAKQFKQEMTKLNKTIKDTNKGMIRSFTDIKAAGSVASMAIKGLARAFDEVASRGGKFANLQANNTLSIDKAAAATQGLISKMDLLTAANSATAFNLGLSTEQFAKMSEAAVIMSQKLGTDANQAIGDLITGMSRMSKPILDNLGILVSVKDASAAYAEELGKTTSQLTDTEKRAGFMAATMKELDRLTKGAAISTDNYGNTWQATKNKFKDFVDETSAAIVTSEKFNIFMDELVKSANLLAIGFGIAQSRLEKLVSTMKTAPVSLGLFALSGDLAEKASMAKLEAKYEEAMIKGTKKGPRKKGKLGKGGGFEPDIGEDVFRTGTRGTQDILERDTDFIQIQTNTELAKSYSELKYPMADVADEIMRMRDANDQLAKSFRVEAIAEQDQAYRDLAQGGLAQFSAGLLTTAVDAAFTGESFGQSMAAMTKAVLKNISIQAAIMASMAFAEYVFSGFMAGHKATAAAQFTAVAIAAGVASAAIPGASGAGSARAGTARAGAAPSFSSRQQRQSNQPISVNVFIGDEGDPSATALISKQIVAQVQQAT